MGATVWVKPLSGPWQAIGSNVDAGIWHEQLTLVSDQWGPKSASFTLKRQRRAAFPDLLARTPVKVEVAGVLVWRGWIGNTPEQGGRARQVNVECAGGQNVLDDDTLERVLVHTRLADYKDARSSLTTNLANYTTLGKAETGDGGIVLSHAANVQVPAAPSNGRVGVFLDLGVGQEAKRVVVTYTTSNNSANFEMRLAVSNTGPTSGTETLVTACNNPSGVTGFTVTGRYVTLLLYNGTASAQTPGADVWVRISSVQVFADTAYESGNASILDANAIIVDGLTRATTGLHPDWSGIGDPSFAFPNFAPDAPRSPREVIAAANAPISQWWFRVDEELRPTYQARPTVPAVELGAWLGSENDSGSSNSDEGIVTKTVVRGQGADSTPVRSTRTQTGTIVDRQGAVVAKTLDTSYLLTQPFADQLGDAYNAAHRVSPFKGQNTVGATGARRQAGGTVHPAHLLLLTGQLARRTDLVDPDTGGIGRTAVIDQVTYRDDTVTADVDLDNTRRDFEALNERLGLLVPTS